MHFIIWPTGPQEDEQIIARDPNILLEKRWHKNWWVGLGETRKETGKPDIGKRKMNERKRHYDRKITRKGRN